MFMVSSETDGTEIANSVYRSVVINHPFTNGPHVDNLCPQKLPEEELTFESMKKVLTEPAETRKEAEARRRKQLSDTFRTATFSELVRRTQPKVRVEEVR
jgi:hypothetical protein